MACALILPALPALPPLVRSHGRMQQVSMITSLRHFRPSSPLLTWRSLGPASRHGCQRQSGQHSNWRCYAAQQLQELRYEGGAATAAATAVAAAQRLLRPGEVHIWWLDPAKAGGEVELHRCKALLTDDELRDCHASDDEAVRRERLLARALVRSVLASYLPCRTNPRSLLFERNSHGKPHLLWPCPTVHGPTPWFNLTHTTSLIGLAVTADGLVGLDVEGCERRTRGDPLRLARRRFSDAEIADLEACPDDDSRAAHFLQLWTLKEAYVKALGRGISAQPGLRSFSFRLGACPALQNTAHLNGSGSSSSRNGSCLGSRIEFRSSAADQHRWEFALIQPAPGHMAAVCVQRQDHNSRDSGQQAEQDPLPPLRFCHFDAAAALHGGDGRPLRPQVLAHGVYP